MGSSNEPSGRSVTEKVCFIRTSLAAEGRSALRRRGAGDEVRRARAGAPRALRKPVRAPVAESADGLVPRALPVDAKRRLRATRREGPVAGVAARRGGEIPVRRP